MNIDDIQEEFDIRQNQVTALYLILYQQAGYPHGKNKQGFMLWVQLKLSDFENFRDFEV